MDEDRQVKQYQWKKLKEDEKYVIESKPLY